MAGAVKTLSRTDRIYPCRHGMAQFGDVKEGTVCPRRCATCKTKYVVTFELASDHVRELTGHDVWRARWSEA